MPVVKEKAVVKGIDVALHSRKHASGGLMGNFICPLFAPLPWPINPSGSVYVRGLSST